jgi:hypothetical protein
MIYDYINSIHLKKTLILSIIIIFYTISSINSSNLSIKGIVGIIISLLLAWYIFDKEKSTIKKSNILIHNIIDEIPILKGLSNYENILMFFYNNKVLINHDYIHYKRSVYYCIEMISLYELIKKQSKHKDNNYKRIKYNYDIMLNKYNHCIKNFKSMEFNVFNYPLINKTTDLNNILLQYVNEIIHINNENIDTDGLKIYKNYIHNTPIEYNNSTFIDSL